MRDAREARARYLLGRLLADVHQDRCAAKLLRDAVHYMPDLVAAYVELGFVYCRLEKYPGMVGALRRAIGIDAGVVRATVRDEWPELEQLRRALYPKQPRAVTDGRGVGLAVPGYVRESWALVELGREHLAAGRDGEAVAALEAALKLDRMHLDAVALLALTHLLMRAGGGEVGPGGLLRKLRPRLARLIFETPQAAE